MSALHWICALTLALVCSLSAQPVKRNPAGQKQLEDALSHLKEHIKHKCPNDTTLYSPTNIHEDCLFPALNCAIEEMNVLEKECNVTGDTHFENLMLGLRRQWTNTSNSTRDCNCELNNETDAEQFIINLERLVQRLNSRRP